MRLRERRLHIVAHSGQGLVEILIAMAVTGVVLASIASLIYVGLLASRTSRENAFAQTLIQDMGSAVRGMAAIDWRAMWGSNGLVGYWGMNEGTDTRLYEPVNGNNGTANGGPPWQTGTNCKIGACLSFDGVDDYVDAGNHSSLVLGTNMTIAVWLYPSANVADWVRLVGKGNSTYRNYGLWRESDGDLLFQIYSAGGGGNCWNNLGAGDVLNAPIGVWTHFAATYDGSNMKVYTNGVLRKTCPYTQTPYTSNDPLTIGYAGYHTYFNGRIDEVRVYNRALSDSEIADMYATPGGLYPKSFGGFWTVYEGAESVPSAFGTFQRWYTLENVQRASLTDHTIVSSGGIPDPSTVKVTYFVKTPRGKTISTAEYVTRSESRATVQTDWSGGPGATGIYTSATNQFASSTNINYTSTTGQIRIKQAGEP